MSEENVQPIAESEEEAKQALNQEVKVEVRGACERHITVEVSADDVTRYYEDEFAELAPTAQLHGFRVGKAPRKLVEKFYKKEVSQRVKANLLTDSIDQATKDEDLAPISEPDFNVESIELVENAPFVFEFDLEVRPEFDVPQWKGLKLERPVREFTDKDVDTALESYLAERGELVPIDEAAKDGDYIITDLSFSYNGNVISSAEDETIRIRPVLSFRDAKIEGFNDLMAGAKSGDVKTVKVTLSDDAPNPLFRSKEVEAKFTVKDVKRLELPEIDANLLEELGGFESEAELRDAVLDSLKSQMTYSQYQKAREDITKQLLVNADWDLPRGLLERQSAREMYRSVLEMRRAGFNDEMIRAIENQLLQNSKESTAKSLKEHFIFEKLAENENIDANDDDYEKEVEIIAAQSGESARRVRNQIERAGQIDALRNQIVERKVVEMIIAAAEFTEVPYELPGLQKVTALSRNAGGDPSPEDQKAEEAKAEEAQTEEKAE